MKKQLVAFLSMFSLVLVLSIYYVMLPYNASSENQIEQVSNVITNAADPYFESLNQEQINYYDQTINENILLVSSKTATSEEVVNALETVETISKKREKENIIKEILLGKGYVSCFIQVDGNNVYTLVKKSNPTSSEIVDIIEDIKTALSLDNNSKIVVAFRD